MRVVQAGGVELDELHVGHAAACPPGGGNAVAGGGVGLVVYRYTLPAPPVARMVCGALKVMTSWRARPARTRRGSGCRGCARRCAACCW